MKPDPASPDHRDDDDERLLAELFDATAAEPAVPQLQAAARAAARIPGRRRSFWSRLMRPGPLELVLAAAVGGAAVGAGVWFATRAPSPDTIADEVGDEGNGDELDDDWAVLAELDEADLTGDPAVDLAPDVLGVDDPLAALAGVGAGPMAGIDLLYGPPLDADVDAWGAAYDSLLDGS